VIDCDSCTHSNGDSNGYSINFGNDTGAAGTGKPAAPEFSNNLYTTTL